MTPADLYEQCSAASALCVRLTLAAQVYGGSLSLVVGPYLWSGTSGNDDFSLMSTCSAGDTVVSGLWTVLNNNRISGSLALTYFGGTLQALIQTFRMLERLDT